MFLFFVCVLLRKRVADGICKLLHGHMAAGVANVDNVWIVVLRPACQAVSNVPGFEQLAGAAVIADLAIAAGVVDGRSGDGAQVGHFDSVLIDFHFVFLLFVLFGSSVYSLIIHDLVSFVNQYLSLFR